MCVCVCVTFLKINKVLNILIPFVAFCFKTV